MTTSIGLEECVFRAGISGQDFILEGECALGHFVILFFFNILFYTLGSKDPEG